MKTSRERWSKVLMSVGYAAMLAGAVDLMEGSLLILPGSALVLAGTYLDSNAQRFIAYRLGVLALLAVGIGALFGLSTVGGFGGKSGPSGWWGLLVLPYLVGWPLGILGPGNPRWVHYGGVIVGLWFLAIPVMMVRTLMLHPGSSRPFIPGVLVTVAALGVVTISGCVWRLKHRLMPPAC